MVADTDKKSAEDKTTTSTPKDGAGKKVVEKKEDTITEEDRKLQEDLNTLVDTLRQNDNVELYRPALDQLRNHIRESTTSMTSVPKPLKFMLQHLTELKAIYTKIVNESDKMYCADVLSVLMMVSDEKCACLTYRLLGNQSDAIGDWGHEYVRHLCTELTDDWKRLEQLGGNDEQMQRMLKLARDICAYDMAHNAETEACDLLMEIDRLDILHEFVDKADQPRVCRYLLSCVAYVPSPENTQLIRTAYDLCMTHEVRIDALRCAIMLNDVVLMKKLVMSTTDTALQRQMAIVLGRHQIFLDLEAETEAATGEQVDHVEAIVQLNSNAHLYLHFQSLARELDIMEPKTPEDIYKTHLEPVRPFGGAAQHDSAKANLANAFVNGLINTGFGKDKHITPSPEYYKNKEYGIMSAAASTGLVMRWDLDGGLNACDRFLYVSDHYVKAGNLLAMGICSSGIQDQVDPAAALLLDYVNNDQAILRVGSILGLGLAYANSKRASAVGDEPNNVLHELKKILSDTRPSATPEVKGVTALSIGLIMVGTANGEVAMTLSSYLMERTEEELAEPNTRFIILALALVFLGTQDAAEVTAELVLTLPQPYASLAHTCLDVCAYAGTGNVLKIQSLLHICSEHYGGAKKTDADKPAATGNAAAQAAAAALKAKEQADAIKADLSTQQSMAVLGIGLIAMGEDIGTQMAVRTFAHLFRYGEPCIRRAVPLGMALLSISNPQLSVIETLHKYSHDADSETAYNAILALGLVGAGSNNARLSNLLRQLAVYHAKDAQSLMLVRIAQGLTHLGKGTMTLNPYHSDRQLMCPVSVAALTIVCFAFLDAKNSILNGRQHYLLYCLVPAIQPRMLITAVQDENNATQLKQCNVSVRVGQAVDNVGQAGKPKSITGFRTHTTPVLLATGERAELVNDEYISLTPYLEGLVILKKNPDYKESTVASK